MSVRSRKNVVGEGKIEWERNMSYAEMARRERNGVHSKLSTKTISSNSSVEAFYQKKECYQCGKTYKEIDNFSFPCRFHKISAYDWERRFECCNAFNHIIKSKNDRSACRMGFHGPNSWWFTSKWERMSLEMIKELGIDISSLNKTKEADETGIILIKKLKKLTYPWVAKKPTTD